MKNGFNLPSISNAAPACLPSTARPQDVNVKIILHPYKKIISKKQNTCLDM